MQFPLSISIRYIWFLPLSAMKATPLLEQHRSDTRLVFTSSRGTEDTGIWVTLSLGVTLCHHFKITDNGIMTKRYPNNSPSTSGRTDRCQGDTCPGATCPDKDRCPGDHLSGWAICPTDICLGSELIGVFYILMSWWLPATDYTDIFLYPDICLPRHSTPF